MVSFFSNCTIPKINFFHILLTKTTLHGFAANDFAGIFDSTAGSVEEVIGLPCSTDCGFAGISYSSAGGGSSECFTRFYSLWLHWYI